jgi:glutathione S-transferase
MIRYVELSEAKAARGVRMAVAARLPSPWSEGAKGVFRIANVEALAVRYRTGDPDVAAWMCAGNVPAVLYGDEIVRTGWAEIVSLAARLDATNGVLPAEPEARARAFGMINELAGEDGLAWTGRLHMIRAGLKGEPGFPPPVAQFLAGRYGADPGVDVPGRLATILGRFDRALSAAEIEGHPYLFGPRPSAADVYLATSLTPLLIGPVEECPDIFPKIHAAFSALREAYGRLVPERLVAHRRRMLEQHLGLPMEI